MEVIKKVLLGIVNIWGCVVVYRLAIIIVALLVAAGAIAMLGGLICGDVDDAGKLCRKVWDTISNEA